MAFGIRVFNGSGVETLGPNDFTLLSLGKYRIPEYIANGVDEQNYNPQFTLNIPGYNPSNCFVVITPETYIQGDQVGYPVATDRYVPTYSDLGGSSVGIYCALNYGVYTGVGNNYKPNWSARSCACTVEAFKFS